MGYTRIDPGFPLGNVMGTTAVARLDLDVYPLLRRHKHGDFGDQSVEEKSHNYSAMGHGFLVRSKYDLVTSTGESVSIYIETNAARTETMVCLVDEY